jgi:hypothetical protein
MSDETRKQHNENCSTDGHNEHLCYLQYEGFHFADKAAYKALVQDAQYICRNCGRTAKNAANLCAPVAL